MTIRNDITVRPVREVEKEWMTREGAADYLGISEETIRKWNYDAVLRYSKVRGRVFIAKRDIDKLIEDNMVF